ncbi:hypothetical protein FRC03_012737 [Tulasnella sp. 419]|nr:hypothetical protein FRC03_012737 [Tulasnella sp. 419]
MPSASFNVTPDTLIPTPMTKPRPAFQVANTFFTGPEFNKASKFCNSNLVCDYDCPSGSVKGCNGKPGCYSICTSASAIPAKKRRQARVSSQDKRTHSMKQITHLPADASRNENEEKLCPSGLVACPIVSQFASELNYECVDPMMHKNFCGGCPSTGTGVDCEGLEGASNVQCINGQCVIKRCTRGYVLSTATDGSTLCHRAF